MANENSTKFLTTAEVAKLLGVQLRWVQTLIQKKRLKASKPGGRDYLIDRRDLAGLQIRKRGRPRGSGSKRTPEESPFSEREHSVGPIASLEHTAR